MMWPFKWKLSACTFTWCYLFLKILENEIWKFGWNLPLAMFGSERVKIKTIKQTECPMSLTYRLVVEEHLWPSSAGSAVWSPHCRILGHSPTHQGQAWVAFLAQDYYEHQVPIYERMSGHTNKNLVQWASIGEQKWRGRWYGFNSKPSSAHAWWTCCWFCSKLSSFHPPLFFIYYVVMTCLF